MVAGEALVAGYSRGKLWRTRLAKTEAGYVAQTHLLATVQALTVDACVSPRGDLVVATHGGQPDWGTGPGGKGRLWQVRRTPGETPLPVMAWNADPGTLRVAFDRPVDPEWARGLAARARIESGQFVYPGDRFETIRPGYQIVYDQLAAPRHRHEILSARLSRDRRTLSLQTRPRPLAVNHVVTLPARPVRADGPEEELDLLSTLHGVEVRGEGWSEWLPHLDLAVAREFTRGSAEHEALFQRLAQPGRVVFRGALDLWQMLQPAIQPGSAIDWERPPENVRVRIAATAPFEVRPGEKPVQAATEVAGKWVATLEYSSVDRQWRPFELTTTAGPGLGLT
ncbi:MAG: heme-binding protein, partial [Verrucomicrobiota bacterium]